MCKDFVMCPKQKKRHRNPYLHADDTNDYVSPHIKEVNTKHNSP